MTRSNITRNDLARKFYAARGRTKDITPAALALTDAERAECERAGFRPSSVCGYMLTIYTKRGGRL